MAVVSTANSDLVNEYKRKVYFFFATVCVDAFLNALVDGADSSGSVIAFMGVQVFFRLVGLFVLFLIMWQTFVFRYGLLAALSDKLRTLLLSCIGSFFLTVAFRVYRIVVVGQTPDACDSGKAAYAPAQCPRDTINNIWTGGYQTFYVIHTMVCIMYYVVTLKTCLDLGDPNLYKPSVWLT